LGIRPDAAWAHSLARRLDHHDGATGALDLGDVIAGERGVPDVTRRRRGDAVRSEAPGRFPQLDLAGSRRETPVEPDLAGEPGDAFPVESRRIEVGVGKLRRKRKQLYRLAGGIDPRDRVLTALG